MYRGPVTHFLRGADRETEASRHARWEFSQCHQRPLTLRRRQGGRLERRIRVMQPIPGSLPFPRGEALSIVKHLEVTIREHRDNSGRERRSPLYFPGHTTKTLAFLRRRTDYSLKISKENGEKSGAGREPTPHFDQSRIPGVMPIGAVAPPIVTPIRAVAPPVVMPIGTMVMPPPGVRMPAMPRVSVPPAPRFCRLSKGRRAEQKGGKSRQHDAFHSLPPFFAAFVAAITTRRGRLFRSASSPSPPRAPADSFVTNRPVEAARTARTGTAKAEAADRAPSHIAEAAASTPNLQCRQLHRR